MSIKSTGLNLLCDYSSDSENESDENKKSSKERLPVPVIFKNNKKEEDGCNPSQHEGRIRSFPHLRGNWASYVYIPYSLYHNIRSLCEDLFDICLPSVEMKLIEDPHISLTRTFVLLHHWINDFISSLRNSLLTFKSFQITLNDLEVYLNEEETRTFIGIKVECGKYNLSQIVQVIDVCLEEYKLQPFYEDESFHVSVGWCLGNCKHLLIPLLPELKALVSNFFRTHQGASILHVDNLYCKTGNRVYNFKLD